MPFYRNVLLDEPLSAIRDPLWLAAATLARKLDSEDQEVILTLMRQAAIDASSTLLGAVDGSTSLDQEFIEVTLTDNEGTQHNAARNGDILAARNGDILNIEAQPKCSE